MGIEGVNRVKAWVKERIATHAALASVHHTKYSDVDAVAALENRAKCGCRVFHSGNISIASATRTKIIMDTEIFDLDDAYASSKYTVKTAGYYQINSNEVMVSLGDGKKIILNIYKNGAEIGQGRTTVGGTDFVGIFVATILYLNVDDYIETYIYHNHGSPRDLHGLESANSLSIFRLI